MTELAKKATPQRRMTLDNRALRRELSDGGTLMKKLIGAIAGDGAAARGYPRSGPGRRPRADRRRDRHRQDAGGPCAACGGRRRAQEIRAVSCAAYDEDALAKRSSARCSPRTASCPLVEEARGGTLVLEDIEALPQALQARLLTFINEQGTPPETRIVAISNLQEQGKTCEDVLRPDLFYRLAAMKITVPPLRQRGEDILTLFTHFGDQFAEEYGCDAPQVSAQEAAQLLQAPWPGNVRQLINVAERAVLQNRRGSGTIASLLMADHEDGSR
jgi:DNA-binding NtrC family response regulator